ncbi:MAG: RluA family pseudouridine synthase [Eubacteriales bacterium]|nr:RluA family pseudouridine synthase [Eubacteriales bacterium]
MKEIIINDKDAGQRFDKLLVRYLGNAPVSFLYKMMRKKNITLNGKKASGKEMLSKGDIVRIFFSDETYEKFTTKTTEILQPKVQPLERSKIIYEDMNILVADKPAGVLSQKSKTTDISINEEILKYLLESGELTSDDMARVRPSVCNRLDRNTSGLILAGKTLAGLQTLSELLRSREFHKYYLCLVHGKMEGTQRLDGYLWKNEKNNKVTVLSEEQIQSGTYHDAKPISTRYHVLGSDGEVTLLEVLLITGRSHQIRAHLASIGHPILGDVKYGKANASGCLEKKYDLKYQLLHSYKMIFPEITGKLSYLSGQTFEAPLPKTFDRIVKEHIKGEN